MGRHRIRTDAELHAAATARGRRAYHAKKARLRGEPPPEPEAPAAELLAPLPAVPPDYDPVEVLKQLSLDPRATGARVAACKILIDLARPGAAPIQQPAVDRVSARAIQILASGRLPN
jgi:hypothetical protein